VNEGASAIAFKKSKKKRYAGEGERENEKKKKPQDIATGAYWQNRGSPRRLELIQGHHTHRDISVLDHFTELLKADLAIQILVRLHHGLIHDLKAKIVRHILAASPFGIWFLGRGKRGEVLEQKMLEPKSAGQAGNAPVAAAGP